MLVLGAFVYEFMCVNQVEAGLGTKTDRVWLARGRQAAVQRYLAITPCFLHLHDYPHDAHDTQQLGILA